MTRTKTNNKSADEFVPEFRGQVLNWYDKHQRILPWRAAGGKVPDPYHVWLSEIMLQQTTVGAVKPYFLKFIEMWPSVEDLAAAETEDVMKAWAGLGYYARARNLHKCAKVVAYELSGVFPRDESALKALPGVGDYTSAAIRTIAFNKPATVMDGNIERIMARYFAVTDPLPKSKPQLKMLAAQFFDGFEARPGDFAQALMDIGATICIGKTPRCVLCPLAEGCQGKAKGIAETLPRKDKKKAVPKKIGHVYWIENEEGQILLHRRPDKGLLGGMAALPTSDWVKRMKSPDISAPLFIKSSNKSNKKQPMSIHHVFTHFELELILERSTLTNAPLPDGHYWSNIPKPEETGFPTVFQKAFVAFIKD